MEINKSSLFDLMDFSLCSDDPSVFNQNTTNNPQRKKNNLSLSFVNEYDDGSELNELNELNEPFASLDTGANEATEESNKPNGIELDLVKHKISSIWNNVKYGWTNYLKKPSKIELDSNEPVFILGKKFLPNNYDMPNKGDKATSKWGNSSFYYLNESPNSDSSITTLRTYESELDSDTNQKKSLFSIINPEGDLSMSYSYLSTSPTQQVEPSFLIIPANPANQTNQTNQKFQNKSMKTALEQEIYSRLWFTYRKDFEPLSGNTKYTSDCGWGCMLRSAQMLIAQGLLSHHFGSNWSLYTSLKTQEDVNLYKEILCLFNDRPSLSCPFGLHNLLDIADQKQKVNDKLGNINIKNSPSRVGSWFGPTSVCMLMRDSINKASSHNQVLKNIRIYAAQDCTIFKQDILDLCLKPAEFVPCIILISARLGGDSINEIYVDSMKMYLEMDNCIGIIGGRPKHSLYFIGYQGEKVIFLDPHLCQPAYHIYASNNDIKEDIFDNKSFHSTNAGRILFSKLDPSVAIGFYIKSLEQLNEFCSQIKRNTTSDYFYPIFGVSDESFEKTQLNYEALGFEEKPREKPMRKHTGKESGSTENKTKYFNKLLLNYNLNNSNRTTSFSSSRSSSVPKLNKIKKSSKQNDSDDFVLV